MTKETRPRRDGLESWSSYAASASCEREKWFGFAARIELEAVQSSSSSLMAEAEEIRTLNILFNSNLKRIFIKIIRELIK